MGQKGWGGQRERRAARRRGLVGFRKENLFWLKSMNET